MDLSFCRAKLLVYALPFILITTMSAAVGAQGLFGMGLPGASYFEGLLGGATGVIPGWPDGSGPTVYFGGSVDYPAGTAFNISYRSVPLGGLEQLEHSYANRGAWLGLTLPFDLGPRVRLYASGWSFLRTGDAHSPETYNNAGTVHREWQVVPYWTIIEGLAMLRLGNGFNLLGGLRYDHYTVTFKNPIRTGGPPSSPTDEADLNTRNYFPLVGFQYENNFYSGSLVCRAIGFPAMGGDVKYVESIVVVNGIEASGNYRRGYFLELFTEYTRKFGPGQLGLFARWNMFHGQSTVSLRYSPGPAVLGPQDYDFSLNRTSLTFGGSASLAFNLPY